MGRLVQPCIEDSEGMGGMIWGGGLVVYSPVLDSGVRDCVVANLDAVESIPEVVMVRRSRVWRVFVESGHATMRT
jgi:hypothetical protein